MITHDSNDKYKVQLKKETISKGNQSHVCTQDMCSERDIPDTQDWSLAHWKARQKQLGENATCHEETRQLNKLEVEKENLLYQDFGQSLLISVAETLPPPKGRAVILFPGGQYIIQVTQAATDLAFLFLIFFTLKKHI